MTLGGEAVPPILSETQYSAASLATKAAERGMPWAKLASDLGGSDMRMDR